MSEFFCQRETKGERLFSEVTTARGQAMTSRGCLYLEAIWATVDDDDGGGGDGDDDEDV